MPIINKRKNEKMKKLAEMEKAHQIPLDEFSICPSEAEYRFPTKQNVPAGNYIAELKMVYTRSKNGRAILDVGYEITAQDGAVYHIVQSYPQNTIYLKKLYRAMIAAGLNQGDKPDKFIGVREEIVLAYPEEDTGFGSIIRRVPLKAVTPNVSMQDEDFLDDAE